VTRSKIEIAALAGLLAGLSFAAGGAAAAERHEYSKYWQTAESGHEEAYIRELMPAGFQVLNAPLEGPVYADERGRTLYIWPLGALRNGSTGDRKDSPSNCTDEVLRVSAGLMSPYPPGLLLPDADERRSCAEVWPPVLAADDAEAVGKWTITERSDGSRQWSYDGFPLYTSTLDEAPGDAYGGSKLDSARDGGIVRDPVGPPPDVPADFGVVQTTTGRLLVTEDDFSVYVWDGDEPGKSNCRGACLEDWAPVPAPEIAVDRGDWSVIRHESGFKQWAYRNQPLYTYKKDPGARSFVGSDVPDWTAPEWHNVYTQRAVRPPREFTVQDVEAGGQVLADSQGRTIYIYNCSDDSVAQLSCNHPGAAQEYRLAICGNGDPEVCLQTWPYVPAEPEAVSDSALWTVLAIDPTSGRLAEAGQENALHVWAYRKRPVYTYRGDLGPGTTNGDGIGEFTGRRNGYKAFVLRDDFGRNAFRR
jgi:predicted lipoprotein with Yx(FWY)xxD motif